jgi:outer membrane protein OmpA-like peptidoglycan-associated protein
MMRIVGLLLAGAALPAVTFAQPAAARDDSAPIVVAQQDQQKKNQNQQQQQRQQQQQQRQQQQQQRQQQQQQRQQQQMQQRQQNQQQRQQQQQQKQQERLQERQQKQQNPQQQQRLQQQQDQLKQRQQEQQQKLQQRQQNQQQNQQDRLQKQQEQLKQRQQNQQERQQKQQDQLKERQQNQQERQQKQQDQLKQQQQNQQQRQDQRQERQQEQQKQQLDRRDGQRDQRQDSRQDNRQDNRRDGRQDTQQGRRNDGPRRLDDVRGERQTRRDGNRTVIQEGNRTIVRDGNRTIIRRDETDRFRRVGRDVNVQRFGNETRTVVVGPNGQRIVTVTGPDGRLIRRSRYVNNREVVIIDNRPRGGRRADAFFVALPALAIAALTIPRDRYIVEAEDAPPEYIYGALMAPPVEALPRAYTLDEIRYSPEIRDRMPRIDLDTITFDLGSWEITPDQYDRLAPIAEGIRRAIAQNPDEVFLIEGHTDATGNDDDNLSLSDRRAEAASVILTDQFQIPPENLTTQGYGSQQMKIPSPGPERANRRVTVRRITPLLQQGQAGDPGAPPPQ